MAEVETHEVAAQDRVDAAQIKRQLDRLLSDPHFSHSRRFPDFLRYVVEHTLAGQTELLKERTIGIEVFGKDADYDTGSDPIVRVTAAEIRKRIAQYYQEPGRENELRLSLPLGTYVPRFEWPDARSETRPDTKPADPLNSHAHSDALRTENAAANNGDVPHSSSGAGRLRFRIVLLALIAVSLALAAIGIHFALQSLSQSAFRYFWGPVLGSSEPVLLCIADQNEYSEITLRDAANPARQTVLKDSLTAIVFDDLNTTVKVAGVLQAAGKRYSLRSEGETNLEDLRAGPTIFIGAFDNAWTLRLTNPLRYHFANSPDMTQFSIVDSGPANGNHAQANQQAHWTVDRNVQITTNNYRDYALVARFTDSNTGKVAVVAAGIGRGGTIAAGEFLTNNTFLAQLKRAAASAGNKSNMEVVLSTQIIDGKPGTPRVEAVYFW